MKQKILITGSEGLIGSILINNFKDDYEIFCIDKKEISNNKNYFKIDISNYLDLFNFLYQNSIDIIIHLAASASEKSNWDDVCKNNIIATENIYNCAFKVGIKKIIFASSTHIYSGYFSYPDRICKDTIYINSFPKPNSYYGISKITCENIAYLYYKSYNINSAIIRIGSVTKENKPTQPYHLLWLSNDELINYFRKAINTNIDYYIVFAITARPTIFEV